MSHHNCFLATHAKYFFTLRTKLPFFTLLPCPLTVMKVTVMYIPGNRRTIFKIIMCQELVPF